MTSYERDPLGDVYSDDSNDSFFDEPKATTAKPNLSKPPDKKAITNLFGLGDEKPKPGKKSDWLGLDAKDDDAKSEKPVKKISFDDDDDILNDLGIEKKPEPEISKDKTAKSKTSLMESIFGPSKPIEKHESIVDLLKETKHKIEPNPTKPIPNKPATSIGYDLGDFSREGRRSRRSSATLKAVDPLGLFSGDNAKTETSAVPNVAAPKDDADGDSVLTKKDLKTKSLSNINKNIPDWLEGSPIKVYKSDVGIIKTKPEQKKDESIEPPRKEVKEAELGPTTTLDSLMTQHKLTASHIEYQNTSAALQQQESQILIALQLKKYEENLAQMQKKQQDILMKQEQQFTHLLEKQFEKQQIMENNMRMQQERINNNIQLLLSQPTISGKLTSNEQEEITQLKKANADENTRLYEEMISTLKQRQHEETFLLNESYKKQINILENSMETVENRLKLEFANLSEQFSKTIEALKTEHDAEVNKYKTKLHETSQTHENEIKQIRDNHNRIIDEIKHEYSTMIENLKQIKRNETAIMDNADVYTKKLDNNLEMLDVNSKVLNEIRGKVQQDYGVLNLVREESLKTKEEEIRMMRVTLQKAREQADLERAQLMSLVRNLELKIVEQSQNGKEERWALQQAAAILTARTAAFDREMEFARSALDREREQLKTFKETALAEQEKAILQLTEEKLSISAEKSRLETAAKLTNSFDTQRDRVEIDAAIQVAKQAAERTDKEREKLHKQQSELESLKRDILDKQRQLASKERELEEMIVSAERKAKDGEKALAEAKLLGHQYNSRLKDIQSQLISLTNREKKVAEEKIALSKERMYLHNNLKQIKKCSLCTADDFNKPEDGNSNVNSAEQDFSPRVFAVTDPDILRLRYEINEERVLLPKQFDETNIDQ
ncbi:hypothetical protein RN001_009239 [Aquatica leii]|uniref:Fas-binding factor 1 C-terminal domain-containing protein n=1 Tax=Aquatica leii TaxID=1421715 RepID=A0AAN7SMU5_9COLE|nr:hypothetical protein RN001_009239 [Aquatica leii]